MLDYSVAFPNLRVFLSISAPLLLVLSSLDSPLPPFPSLLTLRHRTLSSSVCITEHHSTFVSMTVDSHVFMGILI